MEYSLHFNYSLKFLAQLKKVLCMIDRKKCGTIPLIAHPWLQSTKICWVFGSHSILYAAFKAIREPGPLTRNQVHWKLHPKKQSRSPCHSWGEEEEEEVLKPKGDVLGFRGCTTTTLNALYLKGKMKDAEQANWDWEAKALPHTPQVEAVNYAC